MNLTKPQKLIYDMDRFAGGAISVICGSMLVKGEQNLDKLKWAVNEIYRLNDALRIRIRQEDGRVSQHITEYTHREVEVLRFGSKAELDAYAEEYAKTPIDLYGDLCSISLVLLPGQYGVLVKFHHMVGDAWTIALIGTQFNKLLGGEAVESCSYADYVESEQTYLQSSRYEKDRAFFLEQFQKCDEVTYLNEKQSDTRNACRRTFLVNSQQTKQIVDYAKEHGTSAFVLFTAALATYMNRIKMNAEKFYIGTAVLNRSGVKEKNTMGMFVNTVPMLMELDNSKSFAENLDGVQKTAFSIFRHQKHNYGDVLAAIRKEYGFSETLYDVMISYQNAAIVGADVETTWYFSGSQNESLQIHIDDRDSEGIFRIHYDYLTDKFTADEIDLLHRHICTLLFDAIQNGEKKLHELELLTAEEKQKLLYDFNDTAVEYPQDECIYRLFEEQVEAHSNKPAIIFKNVVLTYADLAEIVQEYANKLVSCGVQAKDIVAIHLERSYKLIAFQLAVLKIGAVFLPVDKRYPLDRIEYMCTDCDVKLLISDKLDNSAIEANVIALDKFERMVVGNHVTTVNNQGVCYIIYTSGSTGKPKGCMLTNKGLFNFCKNNNTLETLNEITHCVFACVNSVSFDYFIAESLLPLTNGFTTVVLDDIESTSQERFLEIVEKSNINVVMTTPTRLKMYFADKENCHVLDQLQCICTSGEPLTPDLLMRMCEKSPKAQIYNPLGPSECSVWVVGGKMEIAN